MVYGQVPEALQENATVANHKAVMLAGKEKIVVAAFFLIFDLISRGARQRPFKRFWNPIR